MLRSTVYHAADPVQRRSVHATLAELAASPSRRAWHLAAAADAPDEEVAAALELAASEARARGGMLAAARAFERAANLSTDDVAPRPAAARGGVRLRAGQPGRPRARAGRPRPGPGPADTAPTTEVVRVRGRVEMRRGAPVVAHDLLVAEAERIAADDPGNAAWLLLEAAGAHMMTGDMEALIATGDRARALLAGGLDPPIEALAGVLVGEAHAALGHEDEADALLDPAMPLLTGEYVLALPSELVAMAGQCGIWYERWDRATAVLDHLVTIAREASAINHLIFPLVAHVDPGLPPGPLGHRARRRGRGRAAGARDRPAAAADVRARGARAGRGRRWAGATTRAPTRARRCTSPRSSTARRSRSTRSTRWPSTRSAPARWRPRSSYTTARSAAATRLRMQRGLIQYGADRVEALARAGRTDAAFQALEEFADTPGGGRWALAALARCRGILADKPAEHHFLTALSHHEHDGQPFENARTQLAYGERLRRDRRRADAREQLAEALDTFERLGAAPWADRTRVEMRATGGAAAEGGAAEKEAVAAAGLEELTAHELQIARLVAYGETNRQVAAKLFLSPKTIEYHLSQIYRKLDLRSRTQLASLMAQEMGSSKTAA